MKADKLIATMTEVTRFVRAVEKLREAHTPGAYDYHECPVEQGAVRRASLDLTRSLAELRKP